MKLVNPTKGWIRNDSKGLGHHGAPRGNRKHDGSDLVCYKGQPVCMPFDGVIARESLPYKDDLKWRGAYIVNPQIEVKMWYFRPYKNLIGKEIKVGTPIGIAQDIGEKYKGVTPHIHLRIVKVDPMLLFEEGVDDFDPDF